MKRILLLSLFMICCMLAESSAQDPDVITQDFTKWPDPVKKAEKGKFNIETGVVITINKISGNDLTNFLKRSVIKSDEASKSLKDLADIDIVKVNTTKKEVIIKITKELTEVEGFKDKTLTAILDKNGTKIPIPVMPAAVAKAKDGKTDTTGNGGVDEMGGELYFIPTPRMEAQWAGEIPDKQFIKLNYHTRWAIVYDFSKEDPVSIYKRLNTVIGSTCDDVTAARVKKGKNGRGEPTVSGVSPENGIDSALVKSQENLYNTLVNLSMDVIRKEMDSLNRKIATATTPAELDNIDRKLSQLRNEVNVVKGYPRPGINNMKHERPLLCDNIYKIKEVRKLSPTVNRSLLLVVPHYHPYRDSIVLSADYGDRFLQDAALFNTTFMGSTGAGTSTDAQGTGKETFDKHSLVPGDTATKSFSTLQLFTKLRDELKEYATKKMNQETLDVEIVENGVAHIKERMTTLLGITDFTATGILKAAELKSKDVKKEEQEAYFKVVHEVVDLFLKIANYKRYDNHNLLIENKDLISLTLNRYRDGKLVTMNKEAVRSYYTAGGVKVDFSVGLFGSSLIDKEFTTKTEWFNDTTYKTGPNGVPETEIASIDSVQRKRILKKDKGNFNIGPAVMTHIYWRSGTDVNFSATAGIAINQQAMPRYLFGGSVMFGRDSRWVLSSGVALGPIKDLDGGYKADEVIELNELSTIPLKDVWKSAWFLSLTFNMGGFNVGGR